VAILINSYDFWSAIRRDTERAQEIVDIKAGTIVSELHYLDSEEQNLLNDELIWILKRLRLRFLLVTDLMRADSLKAEFENGWTGYEKDLDRIEYVPSVDVAYSPALQHLTDFFLVLQVCLPDSEAEEFRLEHELLRLERVLKGISKIVHDRGAVPNSEADLQRALYSVLVHVFPDTVREVPIPQISKSYRPDFGIKSLKAAVELKFVASEEDAKNHMGGIYADVHGYSGASDWTRFYAVFYMTSAFMTEDQLQEEWRHTGMRENWKLITVVGSGQRKKRKRRSAAQEQKRPKKLS
jgi:hypothetical protein